MKTIKKRFYLWVSQNYKQKRSDSFTAEQRLSLIVVLVVVAVAVVVFVSVAVRLLYNNELCTSKQQMQKQQQQLQKQQTIYNKTKKHEATN